MTDKELLLKCKNQKKNVIVCASVYGEYLVNLFSQNGIVPLLCDNSKRRWGKYIGNILVCSVEKTVCNEKNAHFIISNNISFSIIKDQLVSLGVSPKQITNGITYECQEYANRYLLMKKTIPLKKIQFEYDVVSHCNLNCKCCSQFSCIADEEFVDLSDMKRDFYRMGKLFNGECERIYLIGGEPLLHPNIEGAIKIARDAFPKGSISVFTNGILLLSRTCNFWKTCRDNKIKIIVTKYPINLEYNLIQKKAEQEDVEFEFFGTSESFKYMTNLGLDISGRQDINISFANCNEANNCIKLRNGKLSTCTRPASIYRFNKFFGMNLEVSERDYVDIYKVNSGLEILEKIAMPINFCRYCNKLSPQRQAMEWARTNKNICEWI